MFEPRVHLHVEREGEKLRTVLRKPPFPEPEDVLYRMGMADTVQTVKQLSPNAPLERDVFERRNGRNG
jgi:hypothetical protein